VTNLDRARGYTEGKQHVEDETELKIAAFVGLNAPPTPPPAGPAAWTAATACRRPPNRASASKRDGCPRDRRWRHARPPSM
jgi:hypothetical protein